MASYEGFYGGGMTAFAPEYGSVGYKLSAAGIGFPGSPQSANQVQDVVNAVKHGTKTFEVTMLQPDVGESIPKQHFEEMRALMKLTGVKPSVHAPLIDAAGFGEQGWSEEARSDGERRMWNAIEKAQMLDPSGNLPIVMHASNGAPGTEWRPGDPELKDEKGQKFIRERATIINQKTGQIQSVKREHKWRTSSFEGEGAPEKQLFDVEGNVGAANRGEWENKLTEVAQMNKHAEELMSGAYMGLAEYEGTVRTKEGIRRVNEDLTGVEGEVIPDFRQNPEKVKDYHQLQKADLFLENAELSFQGAFEQAYEYGTEAQREELTKLAKDYNKEIGVAEEMILAPHEKVKVLNNAIVKLKGMTKGYKFDEHGRKVRDSDHVIPGVYKLAEDFAMDKAAQTFGNLAAKSYAEFQEKAPVLAIENMYQGMAFSRAEDMRELVKKSRENFSNYLVKEKGFDKKKAEKLAQDKLGVTWDVGHLNIMRKKGYTEKDIIEQTKKIAEDKSMVKHIHLTDNFGYADTHLAPGMGNVPIKGILEQLEKTGRLGEMRKIVEAGGMIQHFRKAPHSMTLAAFGSPIYGMKNGPTWNQAIDVQGAYFAGYGTLNPSTHHQYFGAGFTTMPVELGGQMPGGQQSRFGGTPMA